MQPLAIVAGMPHAKLGRFAKRIDDFSPPDGWQLQWVHSRTDRPELKGIWDDVAALANGSDSSGVHILAYHKNRREKWRYEEDIRFRHRLVWLDHSCLYVPDENKWWHNIEAQLRFEGAWRESLRPERHNDPLILPRGTFTSRLDPWMAAEGAENEQLIGDARSTIDKFHSRHAHPKGWRDDKSLIFTAANAGHGQAPENRRWKFTFAIPPGFHFDVKHERKRTFQLLEGGHKIRRFRRYTNVDPHGYVRGGS